MQFRGSLKTDADSYGKTNTKRCTCIRYVAVALIMFAFGMLLGYMVGFKRAPDVSLEIPNIASPEPTSLAMRPIVENTTAAVDQRSSNATLSQPAGFQDKPQLI